MTSRLYGNVDAQKTVMELSQGNPGAVQVIVNLMRKNKHQTLDMMKLKSIKGPRIWVIFKDLCNQNFAKFEDYIKEGGV